MENNNIKKINKIGKVLKVIIIFGRIVLIAAAVICLLLGIASFFIPENAITINGIGNAQIVVNRDKIPSFVDVLSPNNFKFEKFGFLIDARETTDDNFEISTLKASAKDIDVADFKYLIALAALVSSASIIAISIALVFAQKFANALAVCNSPFEENVIKMMKHFGYSLIPWAVLTFLNNEIIISALIVGIILIVSYIFQYGAQLQQESDDTI